MVLLRTSYMYGDFLEYYFRLQFSAFWSKHDNLIKLRHERLLILRCNTTEIIPTPPEKIPNTSENISTNPKKFKPLLEKSQPRLKTPPLQK